MWHVACCTCTCSAAVAAVECNCSSSSAQAWLWLPSVSTLPYAHPSAPVCHYVYVPHGVATAVLAATGVSAPFVTHRQNICQLLQKIAKKWIFICKFYTTCKTEIGLEGRAKKGGKKSVKEEQECEKGKCAFEGRIGGRVCALSAWQPDKMCGKEGSQMKFASSKHWERVGATESDWASAWSSVMAQCQLQ